MLDVRLLTGWRRTWGWRSLILGLIAWFIMKLGREEAALMQARREGGPQAEGHGDRLVASHLSADPDRGAGGGDRRRAQLHRLAAHGRWLHPRRACGRWKPGWRNLFENDGTVQFIHRMAGYLVLVVRDRGVVRRAADGADGHEARLRLGGGDDLRTDRAGDRDGGGHSSPWYSGESGTSLGAVLLLVLILAGAVPCDVSAAATKREGGATA